MAKQIAKKQGNVKRFFGWFGRHKVTAGFSVLIVALALYLVGSWAVLQVQIHFERERFIHAQSDENALYSQIKTTIGDSNAYARTSICSYTSVEIGQGNRSCDVNIFLAYSTSDSDEANTLTKKIIKTIRSSQEVIDYKQYPASDFYTKSHYAHLASDSFKFKNDSLSCGGDYWFVNNTKVPQNFPTNFPTDDGLYFQLNCSAKALSDYFPTSKD